MTTNCTDNKLYKKMACHIIRLSRQSLVLTIVSIIRFCVQRAWVCRILVVPISLRQPCPARLGEMNTTARILRIVVPPWKRKILRWRFFSPSAGLDLVRADRLPLYLCTIRNGIRNFACAFAYNAFGLASSVCLTVGRLLLSMSSTIVPVSSV